MSVQTPNSVERHVRRARRQLLEEGFCIVDGALPEDKLDALRSWSDEWLRTTKHSPK